MRKDHASTLTSALLVVGILMFFVSVHSARGALAQNTTPPPTVRIQPENLTVKKGDIFSINVTVENIPADTSMVGVEFRMSWNVTIIHGLNMTEIMFHLVTPPSEWDNIWQLRNVINNTAGYVFYAYTWQDLNRARNGGYAPISGNYTLATVTLQALEGGSTNLHFFKLIVGDPRGLALICSSDVTDLTPLLPGLIIDGNLNVSLSLKEDLNRDGVVDLLDALLLARHFGSNQGGPDWDATVDINGDEMIDVFDFVALARNYGKKM